MAVALAFAGPGLGLGGEAWRPSRFSAPQRLRSRLATVLQATGDDGKNVPQNATETEIAETAESKDAPWTFSTLISLISGFIGSILSLNAYSQFREATKQREALARQSQRQQVRGSSKSARIVQQLGGSLLDAEAESPLFSLGPVPPCTPASNLRGPDRHFTIITTAALPWRTGTAVNPLLRALYLAKSGKPVILYIPFLEKKDQGYVFAKGVSFDSPEEQEKVVREWCQERAKMDLNTLNLQFRWYAAKYTLSLGSIFPAGDCTQNLRPSDPKDVLILEEPEHLCWFHSGQRWPNLFRHVIGIVHTNYADYMEIDQTLPLELKEGSVFAASTLVCSAYCDVNVKLSDTIMPLPNEVTCNVHGVRSEFLAIGDRSHRSAEGAAKAYYLGKALYPKGWRELLDLLITAGPELSDLVVDGFGSGPDYEEIVEEANGLSENSAKLNMHPGIDHADTPIHGYGVLINPSTSDVLCTVTVEALAMGKHIVLARHVSNNFFESFKERCHFFEIGDVKSFTKAVKEALAAGDPSPLAPEDRRTLTWEAAVERLFDAAEVRVLSGPFERPSQASFSRLAYDLHFGVMKDDTVLGDIVRRTTFGEEEYTRYWGELSDRASTKKLPA